MDHEKVIVVLLVITIALSIISMFITFSGTEKLPSDESEQGNLQMTDSQQGKVSFEIVAPDTGASS